MDMSTTSAIEEILKRDIQKSIEALRNTLDEAFFNPKHERLERMAKEAAHTFFGDIINPTPHPLQGWEDLFKQ